MEVHMRARQEGLNFDYKKIYDVRLALQALLRDFAKRFSLLAKVCTAYTDQKDLQSKLGGNELLLQVAGSGRQLTLNIDFTPSLALYVWQSFRTGVWQPMQDDDMDGNVSVWAIAAEVCSTQGCIAASMANNLAYVPAILALDPLQTLPDHSLLYQHASDSPGPSILPQGEPVLRTLMLFAQLLVAIAADHKSTFANITPPIESTQGGQQLRSAIASKLQQLTSDNRCTPVLLYADPITHDQSGISRPLPTPSRLVSILRSAVLVLKLATLTFNVKADAQGHFDPDASVSAHMLWPTIFSLVHSIYEIIEDADTSPRVNNQEEQTLCAALCEHSVAMLRQGLKDPLADMQRLACLCLLWALLAVMQPQQVRHEVKTLGALPLLVACLDQRREEASTSFQILQILCSQRVDPSSHHADLLARLQGVRRLSVLFCPKVLTGTTTPSALYHRPANMSTVNQEQLHNDVILAHDAVSLAKRLLHLHPLSQRSSVAVQPMLVNTLRHSNDQAVEDGSTQQQFAAVVLPQVQAAVPQRWPTPKPNEWQEIQLVFARACGLLTWALGSLQRDNLKETIQQLIGHVGQVMQLLASGHMPDMDLDMRFLFAAGLAPVLSAQCAEHPGYLGLTTAMLSRLGKDCSLLPLTLEHPVQIFSLFRWSCEAAKFQGQPALAMLKATTKLLHFVMPRIGSIKNLDKLFTESVWLAMTALADNLSDRLMLCACLGAINTQGEISPPEPQNKYAV